MLVLTLPGPNGKTIRLVCANRTDKVLAGMIMASYRDSPEIFQRAVS